MRGGARSIGAAVFLLTSSPALAGTDRLGLTESEQDAIFNQGRLSGQAEACGLDWQALSFKPMMAYWRRRAKTEKQMAFIGALHGMGQGSATTEFSKRPCTDAARQRLRSQLPFRR